MRAQEFIVESIGEVFYHGTNSKFDSFNSSSGMYWFTPDRRAARAQGQYVVAANLVLNNPYDWQQGDPEPDTPGFKEQLISQGYDGIIAPSNISVDDDYIVFSPDQIKIVKLNEEDIVQENFNDGKKPGRKGLAKRVGVNCKQSVSKLRSIAKNSSDKRQRMAHWCANMKSGKRKISEIETSVGRKYQELYAQYYKRAHLAARKQGLTGADADAAARQALDRYKDRVRTGAWDPITRTAGPGRATYSTNKSLFDSVNDTEFKPMPLKLGQYRGPYDPRTMQPYSAKFKDSLDLMDIVDELIVQGVEPQVVAIDPRQVTATQDWLSDGGSNEPAFAEYADRPVILQHNNELYLLDGHHRTSKALKQGRPISAYVFSA